MTTNTINIRNLFQVVSLVLFSGPLHAGSSNTGSANPTNRYTAENHEVDILSHWTRDIDMEIVGQTTSSEALYAASLARVYSDYAGVKFKMSGEVSDWFSVKSAIRQSSNFVVVFADTEGAHNTRNGGLFLDQDTIDFSRTDPATRQIIERGITERLPGCFGDWWANEDNEINALVSVVDSNLPVQERNKCIDEMVPSSFGILTTLTKITYSDIPGVPGERALIDKSEIPQLLIASSFCRKELKNSSFKCPAAILRDLNRVRSKMFQE